MDSSLLTKTTTGRKDYCGEVLVVISSFRSHLCNKAPSTGKIIKLMIFFKGKNSLLHEGI